jgi:lipopolysaccharide transport system permease protein
MNREGTGPTSNSESLPVAPANARYQPTVPRTAVETIRITPHRGWVGLDLKELWTYRELFEFMIWRALKIRYKQTLFGVAWAVLQPVALTLVFTLFLGRLGGIHPGTVPYPVFALAGLVPWTLFSSGLIGASNSLVDSANLLQKVYFPRLLLPLSAIGTYLFDFVIALGVLFALMIYLGVALSATVLWVLPLASLCAAVAAAFGVWLAAINVRYRDVRYAVPFIVQVLLFASPVAYASSAIPEQWLPLYRLNPLTGVIEGFRWALLGEGAAPLETVGISIAVTSLVLLSGLFYFRRVERSFADVI